MSEVDPRALARELAYEVRGEVRFSPGSRALYANDASVYRQLPIGVVIPRDIPMWWPRWRSAGATGRRWVRVAVAPAWPGRQ